MSLPPPATGGWHDVAAEADVPEGCGLPVRVGEKPVGLFRSDGRLFATENICPHRGGTLSDGLVRGGTVICPLHAWQFRLADGANLDQGPGLCTFEVRLEGGRVQVRVE